MKALLAAIVIAPAMLIASCGTVISPTLLSDGTQAVTMLKALDADAAALGVAPDITTAILLATTAVQTGLTDLQGGTTTPTTFAQLATDEINQLAPDLLADFKANSNLTTGIVLMQQLGLLIAGDVMAPTSAAAARATPDIRQQVQTWLNDQKH